MSAIAELSINGKIVESYRDEISNELCFLFGFETLNTLRGSKAVELTRKIGSKEYTELCSDDETINFMVLKQKVKTLKQRLAIYGFRRDNIENWNTEDCKTLYNHINSLADDDIVYLNISDFFDDEEIVEDNTTETDKYQPLNPTIISEGVNDIRVLKTSLKIIYPDLLHNIDFFDLKFKPEGGAGPIVKLAKSFAAANITSRMLIILDNDSAAHAATAKLDKLPQNIRIIHYPEINDLNNYPTIGPQGEANMNVNGLAASIELYLGDKALTDANNKKERVQWKGFIEGINQYQGEVKHKKEINDRFMNLVKQPETLQMNELKNLRHVWDYIINEFGNIPN